MDTDTTNPGYQIGVATAHVLWFVVGGLLIWLGNRKKRQARQFGAPRRRSHTVLVVVGSVLLFIGVTSLAQIGA